MSFHNSFINSTIICNGKKDVDIDALNLLASGGINELCQCSYKNEKGHHHFIYETDDLIPLSQLQAGLTFENVIDILSSAMAMIKQLKANNLVLDDIKNAKEYVFKSDDVFKFIYIPIEHKPNLHVRDYLLKLISVIHHKDIRLTQLIKDIRKRKDDQQLIDYMAEFLASFGYYDSFSEEGTSLLSDEGETTVLNQADFDNMNGSSEGETTVLSQADYNSMNGQAEELVENEQDSYSYEGSAEGETTVLNQADFDNMNGSSEGETTVLSQADYNSMNGQVEELVENEQDSYSYEGSAEGETTVLSQADFDSMNGSSEGETTVLSQADYNSMNGQAEEAVANEQASYSYEGSAEGETTVLSQADFDSMNGSSEGETTVLSQVDYDEDDELRVETQTTSTTMYYADESSECATTVLTSEPVFAHHVTAGEIDSDYSLYFIRNLNGEKISIDVTPFTIGKDSNNMDFVINNNSVSRHHATIIYEDGSYYIMDNHSTNGTTIEGIRLQPDERAEIGNGYIISLGNESFQAHIERR